MYDEKSYFSLIEAFSKNLPKREDGRIDYTNSNSAAVLTVFIKFKDTILLLRRSKNVLTYKGKWSTVTGYLDEVKTLKQKIFEELHEELGISKNEIQTIRIGKPFSFTDTSIIKKWIVYPSIVTLKKKPKILLDQEHVEFLWIKPENIDRYDTVPNVKESYKNSI
jgi:isopentenyldiphosphate isomerase